MTADGTYTAVVDRFEDEFAVLLLEANGETVDERILPKERLPEEGRHVDAIFSVELTDESVDDIVYRENETAERSERAQRRFDALSQRPPSEEDETDTE